MDTDVASSASSTSYPRSVSCRKVLETILTVCHKVVLTPAQDAEWRKHRSRYTLGWLRQMAARGKWHLLAKEPTTGLLDRVDSLPDDGTVDRVEMMKDVHLVEAAMATDGIVLSMDDKMYRRLNRHYIAIGINKEVAWVNPEAPDEACCRWLERGALIVEARWPSTGKRRLTKTAPPLPQPERRRGFGVAGAGWLAQETGSQLRRLLRK